MSSPCSSGRPAPTGPGPRPLRAAAPRRRVGHLARPVLSALLMLATSTLARAVCLGSGDPQIERLVQSIGAQPGPALERIEQVLRQTPEQAPQRQARLVAARALAQGMLGQPAPQLEADLARLSPRLDGQDPALVQLRIVGLVMREGSGGRAEPAQALQAALAKLPPSESGVCSAALLMQVFLIENMPGEAFLLGAANYRLARERQWAWARAEIAARLATVVRRQGDDDYAVALSTEAIAFFRDAGMHDMLSEQLTHRGWAHHDAPQSRPSLAEADFLAALDAAGRARNAAAAAYAQTGLCESRLRARLLSEAAAPCRQAHQTLRASGDVGEMAASVAYAQYLMASNQAGAALNLLRPLLAESQSPYSSNSTVLGLEILGQALRARGQHEQAALHFERALLALRTQQARSTLESAVLTRARFRNEELNHQLRLTAAEHAQSRRTIQLLILAGGLMGVLLLTVAWFIFKNRQLYKRLAFTDALTELPNRRYTETRFHELLDHARARARPLVLASLDLDHFKQCNDRFGHDAGDAVLTTFARTARSLLRPADLLGRWGGEEFVLALPDADETEAAAILQRLRDAVAGQALPLAPGYTIRFSAGTVRADQQPGDLAELLTRADAALYQAKQAGRNQTCHSPAPDASGRAPERTDC